MKELICDICFCCYLWAHACGETCFCNVCGECGLLITGAVCECEKEGASV